MSDTHDLFDTGIKAAGEYLVPGGANLVKGDYKEGLIHAALGLGAKAAFGLPGLVLVSLNSLSKAKTDRHIVEHVRSHDADQGKTTSGKK